jgi:hypothetical protein
MLTSYPIGRPTRSCAATGQPLNVGDAYIAALVDQGGQWPVRVDYSLEAWKTARPAVRTLVAFWRSTVHDPEHKAKVILDDDALIDLFESTGGAVADGPAPEGGDAPAADEPKTGASREAVRFVLGILLIRRRLLTQEGAAPGGIVKLRRRGDPKPPEGPPLIELKDPGLDEVTLAEVLSYLEDLGAVAPAGEPARTPGGGAA